MGGLNCSPEKNINHILNKTIDKIDLIVYYSGVIVGGAYGY